ncbi:hypothetical protein C8R43DRAFT_1180518 [Mycena crocata]|nr:hypothetical protein C8R43DRAFT_1180518 [Mycena crocata]
MDHVMKYLLRLLPLLHREDVIYKFAVYLAGRGDLAALYFATEHCDLLCLLDALVAALISTHAETNVLLAIGAVMLLPQFLPDLDSWNDRDETLWCYLTNNIELLQPFLFISTLMTHRKLYQLHIATLIAGESGIRNSGGPTEEMQRLATLPLLTGWSESTIRSPGYTVETYLDVLHWVKTAMIVTLTGFLSACVQLERPTYIQGTVYAICECLADSFEDVDVNIMAEFAQTWLSVVKYLLAHPEDSDLHRTIGTLFLWINGPVSAFYHPTTAAIFREALNLFLQFLQERPERDESTIEKTNMAVERLTVRMTVDGCAYRKRSIESKGHKEVVP